MKKTSIALLLIVSIALAGCGDKLLAAKTAVTLIGLATATAKSAVNEIAKAKIVECSEVVCKARHPNNPTAVKACLATKVTGDPVFTKCYAKTREMITVTNPLWPQIDQALKLTTSAIAAFAAGKDANYIAPLRDTACLLSKLAVWLPQSWREKIDRWVRLAGSFTCDKPTTTLTPERARVLLAKLRVLLIELGAKG